VNLLITVAIVFEGRRARTLTHDRGWKVLFEVGRVVEERSA
jgi:hypothetical protein